MDLYFTLVVDDCHPSQIQTFFTLRTVLTIIKQMFIDDSCVQCLLTFVNTEQPCDKHLCSGWDNFSCFRLGLGDISFLHRYRDFAGCDLDIADIAILAIMKKSMKPSNNSGTTQRTAMADRIFKSLAKNMKRNIYIKVVTLKISVFIRDHMI